LIGVVAYLVAVGWSREAAGLGVLGAVAALLLSANLAAGVGLTLERPGSAAELWWANPASDDVNRLMLTLSTVSNYTGGNPHDVQVTAQGPALSLVGWALRDFPHARFVDQLDPAINSPVVLTASTEKNPTLGSSYVGQKFTLRSSWSPALNLAEWIDWAAYRR